MRLYLKREYWPTATHGRIFLENREITRTLESAGRQLTGDITCLPEGCYGLERRYTEKMGWYLGIMDPSGHELSRIRSSLLVSPELGNDLAPVTDWKGEGRGIFSRLATLKFRDMIFEVLETGEEVTLEVYCETDGGLNLVQTDKLWMEEFTL